MSNLFDEARLYELDSRAFADDLPYWHRLRSERAPRRILELGCGSGRLALPLIEAALAKDPQAQLVGIDISAALLEVGQQYLAERPNLASHIELRFGDMRSFELEGKFDLIVAGFNVLSYIYGTDDQLACLTQVQRHLAPGGVFGLDLLVPRIDLLHEALNGSPLRLECLIEKPAAGLELLLRYGVDRYDPLSQVLRSISTYELYPVDGAPAQRAVTRLNWQMIFPNELDALLRAAGLRVTERYGDYEGGPFSATSAAYLWLAEAQ